MRLFIGVNIGENARKKCAEIAARLEARGLRARFVLPENYHLTLFFLGNVEQERAEPIAASLQGIASRRAPFDVLIERVGAFPHEHKPRVVFAGSRGVDARYLALAEDVRGECDRLGYHSDKVDAIPHVTLARVPERTQVMLPMLDVAPFSVGVDALTLFESVPHDGKTRYVVRSASRLGRKEP